MTKAAEPTTERAPGVRIDAPAKINLFLHVTGRRRDGYHELYSLVAFAGAHDRIEVRPAGALTLEIDGPFAGALDAGEDNLVVRAARLLAADAGVAAGAGIRLHKALPVAAGIGGGSADAAAALRALCALWGLTVAENRLAALGFDLGADVPVCLAARPSIMRGVGERIAPAPDLPAAPLVLVNPRVPLATPRVFAARSGPFSPPATFDSAPGDATALAAALANTGNDLAPGARRICPVIDKVLAALEAAPSCLIARLSGSGPTCFGLFPTAGAAVRAASGIAAAWPGWWVRATRLRTARDGPAPRDIAGPDG